LSILAAANALVYQTLRVGMREQLGGPTGLGYAMMFEQNCLASVQAYYAGRCRLTIPHDEVGEVTLVQQRVTAHGELEVTKSVTE
jgi:hypothetical protein